MNQFNTVSDFQFWRKEQSEIAFVPTMGNLHEGHLSLVRKAQEYADTVVVSIFVNPMQFAEHEDLDSYPRTFQEDLTKLKTLNVTTVFTPSAQEMYPQGQSEHTQVQVPGISSGLCGDSRPHFFQGVATVVCKLFNIIKPNYAIFGEKDFQQLQVIKKMVRDLNLAIEVVGAPIIREESGLAKSSRNGYLSPAAYGKANFIFKILNTCARKLHAGATIAEVSNFGRSELTKEKFLVDYFEVRDERNLLPLTEVSENARLFVAATIDGTRLIDNLKA